MDGMEAGCGADGPGPAQSGERMVIYGDYDVDGITSISLMVRYLSQLGGDVGYYIPHRMVEGYGISTRPGSTR